MECLNFISKILDRLFLHCIQSDILASPNFSQRQSAYRPGHSTETALDTPLHSWDTDKTRTDTENSHLSKSFADYFASTVSRIKEKYVFLPGSDISFV